MPGVPPVAPYPLPLPDQPPAPAVDRRADARRAVLLIHDMQEYFLAPFARDAPPRAALVHNIVRLRRQRADVGVPVAFTAQPGGMNEHRQTPDYAAGRCAAVLPTAAPCTALTATEPVGERR